MYLEKENVMLWNNDVYTVKYNFPCDKSKISLLSSKETKYTDISRHLSY